MRPIFAALFFGALAAALGASLPWAIVIGLGTVPALLVVLMGVAAALDEVDTRQRRRQHVRARAARGFR